MPTDEEILQEWILKYPSAIVNQTCARDCMKKAREDSLLNCKPCGVCQQNKERAEKAEQQEADFADRVVQLNQEKARLIERAEKAEAELKACNSRPCNKHSTCVRFAKMLDEDKERIAELEGALKADFLTCGCLLNQGNMECWHRVKAKKALSGKEGKR
jgi:predicted RNase H-like nuclease (RuvC/YqgF family)